LYILEITEYVWYLSLNYKVNQKLFAAFDLGIVFIKRLHSFHNSFKALKLICLCPLVSLETISRPRDISLDIIFLPAGFLCPHPREHGRSVFHGSWKHRYVGSCCEYMC